ncbi:hypothetical protein SBV1_1190029 [Verrucomicrobia bacterium]|nr:hypothetical protein SBV1_1190029 [Verrucomicrobiota bacterium]
MGENGKSFKFSKFIEIFRGSSKFFRNSFLSKRGSKFIENHRNISDLIEIFDTPETADKSLVLAADERGSARGGQGRLFTTETPRAQRKRGVFFTPVP